LPNGKEFGTGEIEIMGIKTAAQPGKKTAYTESYDLIFHNINANRFGEGIAFMNG